MTARHDITIYHNASCSNSRGALALLREAGIEPVIIDYLKSPPDAAMLKHLAARAGVSLRAWIREKEAAFSELGLGAAHLTEDQLAAAMAAHPRLINRPIVVTPKGVELCRPPERVRGLLD